MKNLILLLAFLVSIPLVGQNEKATQNRLEAITRVFFNTNAKVLTGGDISLALAESGEAEAITKGGKKEFDLSLRVANNLKEDGIQYTKSKLRDISYSSMDIGDEAASAVVTVTMEMSIKGAQGAPDRTIYNDSYQFSYIKVGNKWLIDDAEYLQPGSLNGLPLPVGSDESLLDSLERIDPSIEPLKKGVNPNPVDRKRKNPKKSDDGGPFGGDYWEFLGSYDGDVAGAYAERHALNPNSSYRDFGNNCTNFVSQAMKAGGWSDESGSGRKSNDAWYYGSFSWTTSYTWGGAHNHYYFHSTSGRSTRLYYYSDLYVGDIISVDMYGPGYSQEPLDGMIDHTVIVTGRTGGATNQLYVSYQSANTLNRPLSDFITRAQGSNGARLYSWGVYFVY